MGGYGERVAERHLVEAGLVVLDRNWRCAAGELDLVALERGLPPPGADQADCFGPPSGPGVLVVCEVKTRLSPGFEHPCEAIGRHKAERLRALAEQWIAAHPHLVRPGCDVRVDLVAVLPSARGAARVEHVKGAC
ncbi:YraN family protein [Yinghuangia soli]|uniref:YraN family protein n=1 Tax=Yinghuangia soli TaxID=2908204 RepID=UPI001F18A311|nr:YraN family protein [Yinghuangia soli]